MKKKYLVHLIYSLFLLLHSFSLCAQLTTNESDAMKRYMDEIPLMVKFENTVRERVLTDPEFLKQVQGCRKQITEYGDLDKMGFTMDLANLYSELGQKLPEYRNVFMPVFYKSDYKITMASIDGLKDLDRFKYSKLIDGYVSSRIDDKLMPDNSFGSMQIIKAEDIEKLRKDITITTGVPASDKLINQWLESRYYDKLRHDIHTLMKTRQKMVALSLHKSCLNDLLARLQKEQEKYDNEETVWPGTYSNELYTYKLVDRGGFIFGTSDATMGMQTESMQWNLTPKGKDAEGDFILIVHTAEVEIVYKGSVKIKLAGDQLDYDMVIVSVPDVTWKEGIKPREVALPKGTKLFGRLRRKKQ